MKYKFGKVIIISLGGSIIHPKDIDVKFLKEFRKFILKHIGRGEKFVIITGGGSTARSYQSAASSVTKLANEDKDWLGIHATRLNAHLMRTIFFREADPVVIDQRFKLRKLKNKITVASGWRPGWSTDYVGLQLAEDFNIGEAIIAGNIAHVYDKDPSKFKNTKIFKKISWANYRKLIPARWIPGSHAPVDPIGARLADKKKLKAIIIKGTDLKNFEALLAGKDFEGTIIS
ncbi:MAG: UMP kinase [bacterium]|nr:UMP kinase [bacterium]